MKLSNRKIIERYESAKGKRSIWEGHWQEVTDNVLPRKNNIQRKNPAGDKRNTDLFESTAIQANEMLAGALHGLLTNPAVQFFELLTGDDALDGDDEVRAWLQDATHKIHNVLNRSNFQTEVHEFYLDLGSIGTASMQIEEDEDFDAIFSAKPIQEVYVCENNKGRIDEIYRCFSWTARKIKDEWGEEALTAKLKRAVDKDVDKEFEIIHCVIPNKDYDNGKKGNKNYEFESRYILVEEEYTLEELGFQELPYIVSRWTKTAGEVYGRSPAMNALPDVKMVNKMMETTIISGQLTIAPPMLMPDDGVLLPLKLVPNGLNYYRSGLTEAKIEPLITNARVDYGFQMIDRVIAKIRDAFFIDQLQLQQTKTEMTAQEVMQRTEDKMRLLGPMLGRQQFEFLKPLVDRVFGIMFRKNRFKPIPQLLAKAMSGKDLDVRYSSLIAKAQRSGEVQNITRTISTLAPFFQIDPSIADVFVPDNVAKFVAKQYGLDQSLLRKDKDIKDIRAGRAKAAATQQEAIMQQHQAELAQKALPAVAKAKEAGIL